MHKKTFCEDDTHIYIYIKSAMFVIASRMFAISFELIARENDSQEFIYPGGPNRR